MDSKQAIPTTSESPPRVLIAGVAWFLSYLAVRYAFETLQPVPHWDMMLANVPILAFFWFVWVVQRALRNADELRRRMHLEALGLAFLTTMLVLMTVGLLDGPDERLTLPLRDLWFVLLPIYGLCFVAVSQRYR